MENKKQRRMSLTHRDMNPRERENGTNEGNNKLISQQVDFKIL